MKRLYIFILVLFLLVPMVSIAKEMLKLQQVKLKEYQVKQYDNYRLKKNDTGMTWKKPIRIPASYDRKIPEHRPYEYWDLGMGM